MKIALPWDPHKEYQDKADEYNIIFVNKPNNFENLMEFLSLHPTERFNVTIDTSEFPFDYSKLKILNVICPNLYCVIPPKEEVYLKLKKYNIKFYFNSSAAAINFRSLEQLAKIGVSSIYIADDLCYDLKNVRDACDKYNLELRWVLDVIPSFFPSKVNDVKAPIMLPECIDELSKYVDVFEFSENQSWAKLNTLYKIWFEKKQWRENLRAIYPELKIDIWNQSMNPNFNTYKMNCKYRCGYGSACKKCIQFKEIADNLYRQHFLYNIS